ncbi:MAG TPA: hypothetical protein DEA50_01230, partial [Parvularcula sp.]|nr:hypothetical protein [Parvularcula sp.]
APPAPGAARGGGPSGGGSGLAPRMTVTPRSLARVADDGLTSVAADASTAINDNKSAAADARPICDMAVLL